MQFKHAQDEKDYHGQPAACDLAANIRLKSLLGWIDQFTRMSGQGEIMITSYYRPEDHDSYHSILQAADIRTKDKPEAWKRSMTLLSQALALLDPTLQIYLHPELAGTPMEHYHIAIKNKGTASPDRLSKGQ